MKKGEIWVSTKSDRTFTVMGVTTKAVTVRVDRVFVDKAGESVLKSAERVVPQSLFGVFSLAYRKAP